MTQQETYLPLKSDDLSSIPGIHGKKAGCDNANLYSQSFYGKWEAEARLFWKVMGQLAWGTQHNRNNKRNPASKQG